MRKKVLLISHACNNLGHLRRVSRIAEKLQEDFTVLVITGMREGFWMIPEGCEVAYFPGWNSIKKRRSPVNGRRPWLELGLEEGAKFRHTFLSATLTAFDPDAILVDYLPFGLHDELKPILCRTRALKYLILRGIIDTSDANIFFDEKSAEIALVYDKVLITADQNIVNTAKIYPFHDSFIQKQQYVGFVVPEKISRKAVRQMRNIQDGKSWVVCSCGGGRQAEELIQCCFQLASLFPKVEFDIVSGPLSTLKWENFLPGPPNCTVHTELEKLADYHAACDLLICTGGYNSIMEGIAGGSKILVYPSQYGDDDERRANVMALSRSYPIQLLDSLKSMQKKLEMILAPSIGDSSPVAEIDTNGSINIHSILRHDLA